MIPRAEPDLWGGKMLVRYVLCDAGCRRRRQRTWSSIDVCGSTSAASTSRRRWSSSNVIQTRCSATAASDRSSSTAPRTSSFSTGTGRASRRSSSTTSTAEGCDGRRTCRTTSSSTSCSSTSWSRTWSRSTSGPRATRPRRARESLDSHVDHHVGLTGKTTDTIPPRSVYHARCVGKAKLRYHAKSTQAADHASPVSVRASVRRHVDHHAESNND